MKIIKYTIVLLIGFSLGAYIYGQPSRNDNQITATQDQNVTDDRYELTQFPVFNFPLSYFDGTEKLIGADAYSVIHNDNFYRSYPTTEIKLHADAYSTEIIDLPSIKTDKQIHTELPDADFMGTSKDTNIRKYGDLARRFVGEAGDGTQINDISYADIDKDGSKETILSTVVVGANVIGGGNFVIKNNKIIFSTKETTFSEIKPANDDNGFYLQWDDNFKQRDGYVTTRFVFEESTFKPVYEQTVRYIRVK